MKPYRCRRCGTCVPSENPWVLNGTAGDGFEVRYFGELPDGNPDPTLLLHEC